MSHIPRPPLSPSDRQWLKQKYPSLPVDNDNLSEEDDSEITRRRRDDEDDN